MRVCVARSGFTSQAHYLLHAVYNWVTGKEAPPPELQGPLIDGIVAFVRAQPLGRASQEVRAAPLVSNGVMLQRLACFAIAGIPGGQAEHEQLGSAR